MDGSKEGIATYNHWSGFQIALNGGGNGKRLRHKHAYRWLLEKRGIRYELVAYHIPIWSLRLQTIWLYKLQTYDRVKGRESVPNIELHSAWYTQKSLDLESSICIQNWDWIHGSCLTTWHCGPGFLGTLPISIHIIVRRDRSQMQSLWRKLLLEPGMN